MTSFEHLHHFLSAQFLLKKIELNSGMIQQNAILQTGGIILVQLDFSLAMKILSVNLLWSV